MTRAKELIALFRSIQKEIDSRIGEFKRLWSDGTEEDLFKEAAFCIFTPQSKALRCWEAVEILHGKGLLFSGTAQEVAHILRGRVRFHNTKAQHLIHLRRVLCPKGRPEIRKLLEELGQPPKAREWLVKKVRGYGMKEASHFLRNIGFGLDLAIIDRHILKNLMELGFVKEMPSNITPKRYIELENTMKEAASYLKLSLQQLDLLLWAKETGTVFK